MNLLRIDTNKGNKVDGGFLHSVFESETINGKRKINIISSTKFDGVLTDSDHIEQYRTNPEEFLKGITDEDTAESNPNSTDDTAA